MSEEDFDIYGDESDDYMGSSDFESSIIDLDGDEDDGDEEEYYDYLDDKKSQLTQYTHATRYTKTGIDTHRMKYVTLNVEEIQSDLENKVKELDNVLQLGFGICMVLLLKYDWNDHKLLDYYMVSNPKEFMKEMGLYTNNQVEWQGEGQTLIKEIEDQDYLCEICYTGPENDQNMVLFGLENCHHQYCIDCYKSYVVNLSNDGAILIKCPFSTPNCKMMMRVEELKELSDYWVKIDEKEKKEKQLNLQKNNVVLMTEDEIMEKFQAESDNDSTFEDDFDDNGEKKSTEEDMDEGNLAVYTYQQQMLKKEREERANRRNKTILTKYWFNVANQYSKKNFKSIKNCPIADCDCMVKLTGFDSDEVATIEEFTNRGLIPIVQCGNKHRFCYSCMEEDHAPCTCAVSKSWKKKCKDDSETAKWISSNTKDCPKCKAAIEKNGGCNHMTCHNCRWEFCWVCMGDWTQHFDNFNCNRFVELSEEDKKKQNETKSSLEKYLFYYTRFENQRTSYEKDKALLEKFEIKILDMQKQTNVSWIETTFYRDCIDTLLESRRVLMWSYGLLFYMKASQAKQLMESAQFSLSSMVERLSRLFEDTKVKNVLKNKNKFLNYRSTVLTAQSRFLDTSLDSLVSKSGTLVGV